MLDQKCYDRMAESLLEEKIKAMRDESNTYDLMETSVLDEFETFLEEHEYADYWDGFKEMATNERLVRWYVFCSSADVLRSLFRAFEDYVAEQFRNKKE